jgi:ribosomal protein S18 acetylase RimI-like enzyme
MMDLAFRNATEKDLTTLVQMLGDDKLGSTREDLSTPINSRYIEAFKHINSDPNNELIVAFLNEDIVGMLQLTFIPYLTYIGSWRCLIEGVRIHSEYRGKSLGRKLFEWSIKRAQQRNCRLIQLTSDKTRADAIKFYESLGFVASHEGFKLHFVS